MKEIIVKEYRNEKGLITRREVGEDLVRCADCKYKQQCRKAVEHITHEPTSVTIGYKSVEWCSYGERKESE